MSNFSIHFPIGRSWAVYQGGGPAVVFLRQNDQTSTHGGSFYTFGFAHENGFFTDFKLGYGTVPDVEVRCRIYGAEEGAVGSRRYRTRSRRRESVSGFASSASTSNIPGLTAFPVAAIRAA